MAMDEVASDAEILARLDGTSIRKHNLRYPVGHVREVRGVFGLHLPEKGRIDVLGQIHLSSFVFSIDQALAKFQQSERTQHPIAIIEVNSSLPGRVVDTPSRTTASRTTESGTYEADTKAWKESGSYSLYEADYISEKLLFRGMYGPHDSGVDANDQRNISKLTNALAKVTTSFNDSDWLRLDCITILFNPLEVRAAQLEHVASQSTENEPFSQLRPTTPRFKWGAAQLADSAQAKLDEFVYEVEHWEELVACRLHDVFPESAFVLALSGPAGTGKTTLASGVADRLSRPIIELSYAAIENALVGEAAKTLKKVFEIAKKTNAVIFIDEADSIASHRPANLTQGADYHISSLRSELFTEISNFDGVLVVATNNAHSYDKAFVSRIYLSLEMELPDKALREQLWRRFLPDQVSKNRDLAWKEIVDASEGLSGRDIANIAKRAAVRAHRRGAEQPIIYDDIYSIILQLKQEASRQRPSQLTPVIERIPAEAKVAVTEIRSESEPDTISRHH